MTPDTRLLSMAMHAGEFVAVALAFARMPWPVSATGIDLLDPGLRLCLEEAGEAAEGTSAPVIHALGHLGQGWYAFCDARSAERPILLVRTASGPPRPDRAWLVAETFFDAIAERAAAARARASVRRLEAMLEGIEQMAQIGIWQANLATGEVSLSDEASRIHGVAPGGPAPTLEECIAFYPEEVRGLVRKSIDQAVAERSSFSFVLPFRRADNELRTVRCVGEAFHDKGLDDMMCGILQDVTEEREAQLRLWWSAHHDTLTGLPNRTLWQDRLDQALAVARSESTSVGLILADLDNFKTINDIFGHEAGDEVLKSVAERLAAHTRQGDTLARLGGDEFAIIVCDLRTAEDLDRPLRRLLEAAELDVTYRGSHIPVKLSMGAAVFPRDASNERELYRNADLALFRSKAEPDCRGTLYSPRYGEEQEGHETRANKIRSAIYEQSLVPCYQPVVRLDDGTIGQFEVLARWQDGERLLEVSAFPSAFEDPELAPLLGIGLVNRIGEDWQALRKATGRVHPLGINASPRQLQNLPFLEALHRLLDERVVCAEDLVLEVKQDPLPTQAGPARQSVLRLVERGVKISFDSLVVGFAAVVEKSPLSIAQVKVRRRVVGETVAGNPAEPVVAGMMETCRRHGIELVACEIESDGDLAEARASGFRYGQGFFLREPLPIDAVLADLSAGPGYSLSAS